MTRWSPATAFPDSAPDQGVRPDRHDSEGRAIAYKLWINHRGGIETAVYRPEGKAASVPAFLTQVLATVVPYLAAQRSSGSGAAETDACDVVDVIMEDDTGAEGCSIGTGIWGGGQSLTASELLVLVVQDVDERLRE